MLYHTIIKKRYYHIMNENDIWLIAGLGNPEAKYDGTRHNAGFAALDALADKWNISVGKTKFQGLWGQGEVEGHKVVLLKPLTYMNLSGDSIAPHGGLFKIPPTMCMVLCDDITQAPGKLRIRPLRLGGRAQRPEEHHCPAGRGKLPPHPSSAWRQSPTRTTTLPPGCWASSRPEDAKGDRPTATRTWKPPPAHHGRQARLRSE